MPLTADDSYRGSRLRNELDIQHLDGPRAERGGGDDAAADGISGGLLAGLSGRMRFAEAVVITTMPRGGLQLAQTHGRAAVSARTYGRLGDRHDRMSYRALETLDIVTRGNCWPGAEAQESPFVNELLIPSGFGDGLAAPLASPVICGYPGAMQVYRAAGEAPFTAADAQTLKQFAVHFDRAAAAARKHRKHEEAGHEHSGAADAQRCFVLDAAGKPRIGAGAWEQLDGSMRDFLLAAAMARLAGESKTDKPLSAAKRVADAAGDDESVADNGVERSSLADRIGVADSNGRRCLFRVVVHPSIEALGPGPFIFICQQLDWADWESLTAADVSADAELARLIPAAKFMQREFRRGPSLAAIAKTVHLSPFHFHRRFTELLGITPKHFMLDSQIHEAKAALLSGTIPLAEIAARCGFSHQSHFTSRFKQATGLTPTRWRRVAMGVTGAAANDAPASE